MDKHKQITLGSLFDGIGGFPYAGIFLGIKPLWASEIMPQAISVTQRRLPEMAHVGDITALDGAKLPPVDVITFGSPCQGLSLAGRRLGLADERSGLFSEAVRIIDEMRRETDGRYPRFAVWENVPGALSSNSGLDYKAVLEAFAKTEVPIPRSGKWATAGMVRSDGIDLAWCVYNAQYFGVPQRRRRIFLVCDFSGRGAGEVLFVAKSLSGYFAARRETGQDPAADASGRTDGASLPAGVKDTAATIFAGYGNHWNGNAGAYDGGHFALSPAPECLTPWDTQQSRVFTEGGPSPTLAGADGGGGRNPAGLVIQEKEAKVAAFLGGAGAKARSIGYSEAISPTLKGEPCGFAAPCVCEPAQDIDSCTVINDQGGESLSVEKTELSPTLRSETHGNLPIVAFPEKPAVTMRLREGCAGGGKGPLLQNELCGTLAAGNDQYLFAPQIVEAVPISTQIATRHMALGEGTGFGVGKDGDPAYTLQQAHGHAVAVGVHQNQNGEVSTAPTAYSLATNGNASGRNAPLVAHPTVCGTLVAPGAGLSRPAGLASETDLCVVVPDGGPIPINDRATRYKNGGSGNGFGVGKDGDPAPTITSGDRHAVAAYCLQGNMIGRQDHNGPRGSGVNEDLSFTLTSTDVGAVAAVDCRNYSETEELSGTLCAKNAPGYSLNYQNPVRAGYIVRRLLPVECERLQGYPDGWTEAGHDGNPISDTRRYQMLGNSVAVPCVAYILLGIAEQFRKEVEVAG